MVCCCVEHTGSPIMYFVSGIPFICDSWTQERVNKIVGQIECLTVAHFMRVDCIDCINTLVCFICYFSSII